MKETRSSRGDVAIFSGKCFMLNDLLAREDIGEKLKDDIVDTMFQQSEVVLGIQ